MSVAKNSKCSGAFGALLFRDLVETDTSGNATSYGNNTSYNGSTNLNTNTNCTTTSSPPSPF